MMPFHAHLSQGDPSSKSALKRIIKPHKKDIAQRAGIDDAGAGVPVGLHAFQNKISVPPFQTQLRIDQPANDGLPSAPFIP